MSTSGWRRRRAATTSRVVVPEPITATRSPRRFQRSTAWIAEARATPRTPRWSEMPSAGMSISSWASTPSDQPPPAARPPSAPGPEQAGAVAVLAELDLAGGAARARREAADHAARVGLDQHALALTHPARAVDLLDHADHLAARDHRQGPRRAHRRQGAVGAQQRQVAGIDPRQRGADERPARGGRDRPGDVPERRTRGRLTPPGGRGGSGPAPASGRRRRRGR